MTLEQGRAVTLDVARQTGDVEQATSTTGFTDAIIANLGRRPTVDYRRPPVVRAGPAPRAAAPTPGRCSNHPDGALVGVDVFVEADMAPDQMGAALEELAAPEFRLELISTRGTKVYPATTARIDSVGWWTARFVSAGTTSVDDAAIGRLLERVSGRFVWVDVVKLRVFGDEEGFTRAQGQ